MLSLQKFNFINLNLSISNIHVYIYIRMIYTYFPTNTYTCCRAICCLYMPLTSSLRNVLELYYLVFKLIHGSPSMKITSRLLQEYIFTVFLECLLPRASSRRNLFCTGNI